MGNLDTFLAVAEAIRSVTATAFLAGGCLRDFIHGKPFKDIDVFVPEGADFGAIRQTLFDQYGEISDGAAADFSSCEGMLDVLKSKAFNVGPDRLEVNVIELEGNPMMQRVLDRMDFGICQIGHDGRRMWATNAYAKDATTQTFTITRRDNEDSYARTLGRWDRLSQKYPGWTLVEKAQ